MLFTSVSFVIFFAIFFYSYWFVFNKSLRLQNLLVLIGSYVFYGCWNWHFLLLLIGYSYINFLLGIYIYNAKEQKTKKLLVFIGLFVGIGLLGYFKYTNFFITSFLALFASFNIHLNVHTLDIIMPLGISFYTFRTLSYLFDINNDKIKPTTDWVVLFSFIAFFPCLLSGPVDKARTLIPQLAQKREFELSKVKVGLHRIFWGLFKKVVVADYLSVMAGDIFTGYAHYNSITLLAGAVVYTVELYADFSGYSDMAIGIAELLGLEVTHNFNYPFFAENTADYWRRWHISLTSWLTEYVFTPLSIRFRDWGKWGLIFAIIINFTIIGIWHGANWTFVAFGFLHGCYFIPLVLNGTFNKRKKAESDKLFPTFKQLCNIVGTFLLVSLTLIVFRSDTISDAYGYYKRLFVPNFVNPAEFLHFHFKNALLILCLFLLSDWMRVKFKFSNPARAVLYMLAGVLILASIGSKSSFIYIQF